MITIKGMDHENIGEAAEFISQLNKKAESHIGYCGNDKNEIAVSMTGEMTDVKCTDSFVLAYKDRQLTGVLGFDADLDDKSAEVWGPFVKAEKWDIVFEMWERMIELLPEEIESLEMFPNAENRQVCQLAEQLAFEKHSDERIYVFRRDNRDELKSASLEELTPVWYSEMEKLHDKVFADTYYNGQQIISRINDYRKVFVKTRLGRLAGYIYAEAEPEFGEANIEFFGVEKSERGNGIGQELLTGVLHWLFTFEEIVSVRLCVNAANDNAVNLYRKTGFQHLHDLCAFTKKINL